MRNRSIAPPVYDALSFSYRLPPCTLVRFVNDLPLYWLSAGTQDVVQVDWVFKAGLWAEPASGIAQATAALLKSGTPTKSAAALNEALEYYGASVRTVANNDFSLVTLHCLKRHLPELLPVIFSMLTEANFPEDELAIYVKNARQRLRVNLEKSAFVANRQIDAYLFGTKHPYGRFTTLETLEGLSADQLREFHRNYYRADNCTMFMAGNISETEVRLLDRYFGGTNWGGEPKSPRQEAHFQREPAPERRHRLVLNEANVQGSIRMACPFPDRKHPDFAPMIVLNTVFGGYFGSRLMTNIREEKGYTYGIYSHLYSYRNASVIMIGTEAGSDVCEAAVEEVYKEMDRLCRENISDEELRLVKNYLLGNLLGDLDGPFSIIQRWKGLILNEMPPEQFDANIAIYKQVTATQLRTLAQRYLRGEDYYELVVV